MTQITISGQVLNGNLLPEQSLAPLEGQRVVATLTVVPQDSSNCEAVQSAASELAAPASPTPLAHEEFDPEPPPWLEIENDVYFPMARPEMNLGKKDIIVERGQPCIILPEELPDE